MLAGDCLLTCATSRCDARVVAPKSMKGSFTLDVEEIRNLAIAVGFKYVGKDWYCSSHKAKAEARVARRPEERERRKVERQREQKTFIRDEVES